MTNGFTVVCCALFYFMVVKTVNKRTEEGGQHVRCLLYSNPTYDQWQSGRKFNLQLILPRKLIQNQR